MKVLVIPDVHLKPWMFDQAEEIAKEEKADRFVCLMDIPDDWHQQHNLSLYIDTFDRVIKFAKDHPDTLWCLGNHDISYSYQLLETGYSELAAPTVCSKLWKLRETEDEKNIAFVHRIDNVLFSHAGLTESFVKQHVRSADYHNTEVVLETINGLSDGRSMWRSNSPVWFRPENNEKMYKPRKFLQVTGHTPVEQIRKLGNLILCDVFSTYSDGQPIGNREFLILDTKNRQFFGKKPKI